MASEILIVDDEADIRRLIAGILDDEGYETRQAGTAAAALAEVDLREPALVILDVWLEGSDMDGLEVLRRIRLDHPDLPVVMISGHGTIEMAVSAIQDGAYEFIEKPFKTDRLLLVIERALEAARLRRENEELRERSGYRDEILGIAHATRMLRQAAERAAPTQSRILVTGPAGSGKEVVARYIHRHSRQAGGPFIAVNCASMAPDRVEAELFGIEGSGSNGEGPRKIGFFERAHGGTLFLDEIADMPLETQGKVVRVLHEQTFERVGGSRPINVQMRVLASTQRDLRAEIAEGRFREDLYYRLAVVPIEVPPLSARRDDIPVLARHFLETAARANGQPPREIADETLAVLQAYGWPGNVRQLRNVVDWLLIMTAEDQRAPIRPEALPPEIVSGAPSTADLYRGDEMISLPFREARELFEREYLLAQINRFGGNISRTATFIGMERSALHRKLKALGVQVGSDRS